MDANIRDIIHDSIVDGPGIRSVIFFQGCPHHCYNCHNPQTHSLEVNKLLSCEAIIDNIISNSYFKKLTISGGEPFLQYDALLTIVKRLSDYQIWIYTGYTKDQLTQMTYSEIFDYVDVIVDGLYLDDQRCLEIPYKGSTNQNIIHFNK